MELPNEAVTDLAEPYSNYQRRRDNDDLYLGSAAHAQQPPPANIPLGMDDQNSGPCVSNHQHSCTSDYSYPMRHDTMSLSLNQLASGYHRFYENHPPLQHHDMWYSEHEFGGNWLPSREEDHLTQRDQILPSMLPSTSYSSFSHVRHQPWTRPDQNQSRNEQPKGNQRPHRPKTFPQKLMGALLQNPRYDAFVWTQEGNSFIVVDRDIFVAAVLSKAFNKTKFSSFVRKLHRWGFVRLTSGVPANCFHHPMFSKNCPQNAALIACVSQQGTGRIATEEIMPLHSASVVTTGTQDSIGSDGEGREMLGDNERGVVMTIHLPHSSQSRPHTPIHNNNNGERN